MGAEHDPSVGMGAAVTSSVARAVGSSSLAGVAAPMIASPVVVKAISSPVAVAMAASSAPPKKRAKVEAPQPTVVAAPPLAASSPLMTASAVAPQLCEAITDALVANNALTSEPDAPPIEPTLLASAPAPPPHGRPSTGLARPLAPRTRACT